MSKRVEHAALGIKTKQGKAIYDASVAREGRLQASAAKAKSKKEEARLLSHGHKASADALAAALALNPRPKAKKKAGPKKISLRRRRLKFT